MSVFDLQNATFTESNSTTFTPVPEGEYIAAIRDADDCKLRSTEKGYLILDVSWTIDDAAATEATGVATPKVRQSIFLDTTEAGGLDFSKGKNIQLGRLRDALNQNQSGQPWGFGMLVGGVARVTVKHRMVDDQIYTDVKGVAKAA
jgi:hypothetical protein